VRISFLACVLSVLPVFIAGCPSSSCECAASEFCCLGTCLPLGSTCPPVGDGSVGDGAVGDGAVGDASVDAPAIDCGARPLPSGGSATSASRCMGEAVWYCTGTPTACNAGYHCVEWLDSSVGQFRAGCVGSDLVPCDPEAGNTCEGTSTLLVCSPAIGDPRGTPPGLAVAVDCTDENGPDSSCLPDATGARCTTSSCDPIGFLSRCVGDDRFSTCTPEGTTRYQLCGPDRSCLANDLTAPSATCIPRGAAMSTTRSAESTVLGCTGTALFIAQWGYEWGESCGSGQVCRGAGSSARCVPEGAVPCDTGTFAPSCSDPITETRCVDGYTADWYCGIGLLSGSVPSACDATTGACVPTEGCGGPRAEHCDPTGRFRIHCEDALGRQVAEPCASCRVDGTGAVLCG
jgi:hypothetical protein